MSNASIFRRYARTEDAMIRATMPRISAADPEPIFQKPTRRTWAAGSLVVKAGFTLAEVAHA
jgi:hypothetical protein